MHNVLLFVAEEAFVLSMVCAAFVLIIIPLMRGMWAWRDSSVHSKRFVVLALLFLAVSSVLLGTRQLHLFAVFLTLTNLSCLLEALSRRQRARRIHAHLDELAIHSLRQQVAKRPDDALTFAALGDMLLAVESYDSAIAAFEQVVKLQPDDCDDAQWKIQRTRRAKDALLRRQAAEQRAAAASAFRQLRRASAGTPFSFH